MSSSSAWTVTRYLRRPTCGLLHEASSDLLIGGGFLHRASRHCRNGGGGSLTGRIAYTAYSFAAVGGYDEEPGVLGSGSQDVDICVRLAKQAAGGDAPADVWEGIGDALPNDPSGSMKLSNVAKVANLSQGDFQAAGGSTWGDVNKHNWKIMKAKMSGGYTRNGVTGSDLPELLASMARRCGNRWSSSSVTSRSRQCATEPTPASRSAGGDAPEKIIADEAESAKITFYTAGLLFVGAGRLRPVSSAMADEGHRAGKKHWFVRETFMQEAFVSAGLAQCDQKFLEFDCRQFRDPERRHGRNHIGLNGFVLLSIARNSLFEDFFGDVMRRIVVRGTGSGARQRTALHVVFYCKKGRHRSVAMAHLAAVALSSLSNWSASTVHLADHAWPFETCNNCVECARPRGEVLKAKQEATRIAIAVARKAVQDVMMDI